MLRLLPFLLFLPFFSATLFAQTVKVTGTVLDAETGNPLQYANVYVQAKNTGTTTNASGKFILHLWPGSYKINASYIGYRTHTRSISLVEDPRELVFQLHSSAIELPEVTVTPDDNPALVIIREAIRQKKLRRERLQNYSLTSHSKLVLDIEGLEDSRLHVKTGGEAIDVDDPDQDSIRNEGGNTSVSDTIRESKNLKVLLETQTDAYWAKPDRYKEVIKARKQSAYIPAQGNFIISGMFVADFSADELKLSRKAALTGPISESGLNRYYYKLTGMTVKDGKKLFMIEISPLSDALPLLEGTLYIAEETFALSMVDVRLNEAALPMFVDTLRFRQNFRLFEGEFWMPVDVIVDGRISIAMIVDFDIDFAGLSVLQDYRINQEINEDFFDRTVIKVLKEADERDSTYWADNQKLVTTPEEIQAYKDSDSIKTILDSTRNHYDFGNAITGKTFRWDETGLSVPGLFDVYRYDRVQGNSLYASVSASGISDLLESVSLTTGYGFSDERWKYNAGVGLSLTRGPDLSIGAAIFDRMETVTEDHDQLGYGWTTILSLLAKSDYKDYYYAKGWSAYLRYDAFMLFPAAFVIDSKNYLNAHRNTNWSIFKNSTPFRENPAINHGSITSYKLSLGYDDRSFIDNAGELQRFGRRNHVLRLGFDYNDADLVNQRFNFTIYSATLRGSFDLGFGGITSYRFFGDYTDGALPTQRLLNLYGTIPILSAHWRFRTLEYREFGGDARAMLFVEHNFRDWLFRALGIPLLESSGIDFIILAAGGWTQMSSETLQLQHYAPDEATEPFYEAGFSFDRILAFLRLDFAWRLNHFRSKRNFYIGITGSAFL